MNGHAAWVRLRSALLTRGSLLTLKGGLSAGIAWYLGAQLPDPYADYAFYASLGAVSVIYPVLSDALDHAFRATAAILTGALLASGMQMIAWPNALSIAVLIVLSSAVAQLRVFGQERHWVVTASLFILVFSGDPPIDYVLVYVVQIVLGAAVGLALNFMVFPTTNLNSLMVACTRLQAELVEQLRQLAQILEGGEESSQRFWDSAFDQLERDRDALRVAVDETIRSGRGNFRAPRWRNSRAALMRESQTLQRAAFIVQDLVSVLREYEKDGHVLVDPGLRQATVRAFEDLAELVNQPTTDGKHASEATVQALVDGVDAATLADSSERFLAALLALSAQRCLRLAGTRVVTEQDSRQSGEVAG